MDETVIPCEGDLTIARAASLRETLLEALESARDVKLDCSAATNVDVTFLQLLVAAQRTAAARGVNLSIIAPEDGALAQALPRAGMSQRGILLESGRHAA